MTPSSSSLTSSPRPAGSPMKKKSPKEIRMMSTVIPKRPARACESSARKTPNSVKKEEKRKTPAKKEKSKEPLTSEDETDDDASFEDYSELCERVAKTMYYANTRPQSTPRPSLPLTILAVDTFSKYARKDTLEFLDIDMAAEIGRNACVSPTALVFAMVYLERLSAHNPGYLKTVKPSELFVVSLLVASKFVQDDGEDLGIFNDEWATSAKMDLKRVNQLELEFLTAIDWNINIGSEEYDRALQRTEEKMALRQGAKRGWFTYTELTSLSQSQLTWNVIIPILYERIIEVVSGICVMYTTFFATLITSSVLAPYLSVSKLLLLSSMTNSLLTGSSLSSCLEGSNASIVMPPEATHITSTSLPTSVPVKPLLTMLEEQENKTELSDRESLVNSINRILLHHHRGYEAATGNANYGYSFKCESNYCHDYSQEETLTNLQRLLENLLHSKNPPRLPNYWKSHKRLAPACITSGLCSM